MARRCTARDHHANPLDHHQRSRRARHQRSKGRAMTALDFSKSGPEAARTEPRLGTDQNPPTLKMFERQDWTLFRTVEGVQQKAGVPATLLRRLVLKEIGDNALDTGAEIKFGKVDADRFYVED